MNAATVLSALQTLAGSLHWLNSWTVWVIDVPFAGAVLQPTLPSNPLLPPTAKGSQVPELVAMMIASILRPAFQGITMHQAAPIKLRKQAKNDAAIDSAH